MNMNTKIWRVTLLVLTTITSIVFLLNPFASSLGASFSAEAAPLLAVNACSADVFINEIHYDNAGADAGEFVEVAGPAGTDLSGWSLVFYNGSGGASYGSPDPLSLSGIIDNEANGFGAVSFSRSGIQNGGPDGVALTDGTNLCQFLSYEGAFIATNGIANGVSSTDIGVKESNATTQAGHSLQLEGNGTSSSDFTWAAPSAESPGDLNTGQSFNLLPTLTLSKS
ncbi:MAG: hypothetical protein ACI85U_004179, partial [Candidatus Promineifilaceae bacterium]